MVVSKISNTMFYAFIFHRLYAFGLIYLPVIDLAADTVASFSVTTVANVHIIIFINKKYFKCVYSKKVLIIQCVEVGRCLQIKRFFKNPLGPIFPQGLDTWSFDSWPSEVLAGWIWLVTFCTRKKRGTLFENLEEEEQGFEFPTSPPLIMCIILGGKNVPWPLSIF